MSKTLVVCDNEYLSTLYVLNLEVYLATSVVLAKTIEEGIATHKSKKDFDLIICLEMVNRRNAFNEINEYRGAYGVKTPLVKIGGEKDADIDVKTFGVSSRYDVQSLLKKSATILGVTAKQMAEMQLGTYYPISMAPMEGLTKACCNLYLNVENQFKLFARKDDAIADHLKNVKASGLETIFVKSSDRLLLVNHVSLKIIERITNALKNTAGLPVEKKVELLSDGYEFAAANLFSTEEIRQEMAEIAMEAAKVMTDVVKDNAQLRSLLATMLNNKSGYIFTHSMVTSYVANHIIRHVTWGGDGQSDKINFVLFFHDIYLSPIYLRHPKLRGEKCLIRNPTLTDKETDVVLNHARLAAELVVTYKRCPMGADVLIKHHHGMKKGSGFATRYSEDLSPLSKVLLVAEAFVEQFLETADRKETPQMKVIIPRLLEEFVTPSYIKIVQTLVNLPI